MIASSASAGVTPQQRRLAIYRRKALNLVALIAISLAGAFVLTAKLHPGRTDFIEYWSSGTLLVHHLDPYSPEGVFALEKAHGFPHSSPLVMLNPPWTLFLITPLGFTSVRFGLFLWTLLAGTCLFFSVDLLYPSLKDKPLTLLFAPVIACFGSGQSSPFLLLGFSLFLRFHRSRPLLAGASLLLMAIKPHLFLVFWAVLAIDCVYRRRFAIPAGAVSALAAASVFAMCLDIHVWQQYFTMLREFHVKQGFLPTLSMLLRTLIDVRAFWILFVPSSLAVLWGIWYYRRHRAVWDWRVHGMLLMLVTILASPYGFFTDEIVLLPAIIFALNLAKKRKYSAWILLAINSVALAIAMALGAQLSSPAYIWTPLAWLAWVLYATKGSLQSDGPEYSAVALDKVINA